MGVPTRFGYNSRVEEFKNSDPNRKWLYKVSAPPLPPPYSTPTPLILYKFAGKLLIMVSVTHESH